MAGLPCRHGDLEGSAAARYASCMRTAAACLLILAGCASTSPPPRAGGPISAELLPLAASSAGFVDVRSGAARTLRVEPDGSGARLVLEVPDAAPREIRVARSATGWVFGSGVEPGTEILRLAANPGDEWESNGRRVSFDGWERVSAADAKLAWDAARISARRGPPELQHVETWWFVPATGLVRLRSDHGGMFADELVRTSR